MELPQPENLIQAEYVWIDGSGGLRCKTTVRLFFTTPFSRFDLIGAHPLFVSCRMVSFQTMDLPASGHVTVADCKEWNFDGSSTAQVFHD
jgi:hypothetical protein